MGRMRWQTGRSNYLPSAIRCSLAAALLAMLCARRGPGAAGRLRRCRHGRARASSSTCAMPARTISSAGRSTAIEAPRCLLTQARGATLSPTSRAILRRAVSSLKVFDCYRPVRAVANFVRWARDLNDTAGKKEFYPEVDKRTLFRDGYISSRSGHSRGSTVDLTLARSDGQRTRHGHAVRLLQSAVMARG